MIRARSAAPHRSRAAGKLTPLWIPLLAALLTLSASSRPGAAEDPGTREGREAAEPSEPKAAEPSEPKAAEGAQPPDAGGAPGALPPGVLAAVNGREITVTEYADYLLASIGKSRLGEYIDRLLIEEEAHRKGIALSPEAIEKLVDASIHRTIQGLYQGSRERYLDALREQSTTLDDRKARLRQKLYYAELLQRLIVSGRAVSEEDVEKEFERVYGPGGVRFELRHILISTRRRTGPKGEVLQRSEEEARKRAEKVAAEIRGGADFVEQVKKYSDDTLSRRNDGRIVLYREGDYGDGFHRAVTSLSSDRPLSPVVPSPRGFHIVQWIGTEVTRLEDVRESLEERLRQRPASDVERNDAIRRLRQAAKIVR